MPIMWMRIKIALRNILRHKRRTALNLLMIGGGVAAILLFRGFANHILESLKSATIKTQTGHLGIATGAFWNLNYQNSREALLPEIQKLTARLRSVPQVSTVSARLGFYGLVSSGEQSISARGLSLDLGGEQERLRALDLIEGDIFGGDSAFQVMVGTGIAKRLQLKTGSSLTVLAYTLDGMVNALDLEVRGIFETGVSEIDEATFIMPLSSVAKLLDTDRAEQLVVLLNDTEQTDAVLPVVQKIVSETVSGALVKPWYVIANFYREVDSFFSVQNRVIESIILALVLLAVLNTIGMSVFERTAEIGTLRALGETESAILKQFLLEGAILGIVGSILGSVGGTAAAYLLELLKIPMTVPGASHPITIRAQLNFSFYQEAIFISILASTLAAIFPAIRASRFNITEALQHRI